MWRWAGDLSRTRRARKAAGTMIAPLVERSRLRLGGIPEVTWSDPYIVGFIVMLITIVARLEVGKIEGQALCLVQAKTWDDITMRPGAIGEEVLLLSSARDHNFETGCRNAVTFGSMLVGNSILFAGIGMESLEQHFDLHEATSAITPAERDDVSAAWGQFFDAHVSAHPHCNITGLGDAIL